MSRRTHPFLLDLAVEEFALPETEAEIDHELRRESENNNSLALKLAEAEGQRKLTNSGLVNELRRQKKQSDRRIEALKHQRSKQAFWGDLKAGQPVTASSSGRTEVPGEHGTTIIAGKTLSSPSTVGRKKGRPPSDNVARRRRILAQFATKPSDLDRPNTRQPLFRALDSANIPLPNRRHTFTARSGKYTELIGERRRKVIVTLKKDLQRQKNSPKD